MMCRYADVQICSFYFFNVLMILFFLYILYILLVIARNEAIANFASLSQTFGTTLSLAMTYFS